MSKASTGIPRQSLTSAVAEKLRDKIILGELQEGEQLRQDLIAAEFQVSRIPVREALRQLLAEGLIDIIPNRGAVVSSLSPSEIEELFEIRALLEREVLRDSIPNLSAGDLAHAGALLDKYDQELRDENSVADWGRLNTQFHASLYAGADRPQFMSIIRTINNNGERYTRLQLFLSKPAREIASREHAQLLALCRARDIEPACELLYRHIRAAGRSLRDVVEKRRHTPDAKP